MKRCPICVAHFVSDKGLSGVRYEIKAGSIGPSAVAGRPAGSWPGPAQPYKWSGAGRLLHRAARSLAAASPHLDNNNDAGARTIIIIYYDYARVITTT